MAQADVERGAALAERARQLFLWLEENELPQLSGTRGLAPEDLPLFAGVYRAIDLRILTTKLQRQLLGMLPEEQQRLEALQLGVRYVLLTADMEARVQTPRLGRVDIPNAIVRDGRAPLTRPGALLVIQPRLDSALADQATLATWRHYVFRASQIRADLVWDTEADLLGGFKYRQLLNYERPRTAMGENALTALPPVGVNPETYREHLYQNATYLHPLRNADLDEDGDYYPKYRAKRPLNAKDRRYEIAALSDAYLQQCVSEIVLKRGGDMLFLDLGHRRLIYRLLPDRKPPGVDVKLLYQETVPGVTPVGEGGAIAEQVRAAVVFHALEGGSAEPRVAFHAPNAALGSDRKVVDYRAHLRAHYRNPRFDPGSDEMAADLFDSIFFGSESFPVEHRDPIAERTRDLLFLNEIREAWRQADEPLKSELARLVAWCEEKPNRLVLRKGMKFGSADAPIYILGVNRENYIHEWNPRLKRITRIGVGDWLIEQNWKAYADQVYQSTAGFLPLIALITWGGVAVATFGVVGPAAAIHGAREASRALALKATGEVLAKAAVEAAEPHLLAMLVEGLLSFVPRTDSVAFEFIRGLFEGFGSGALEHYLCEVDDRFVGQLEKIPEAALSHVTRGASKAYAIYKKGRDAAIKIAGLLDALQKVGLSKVGATIVQHLPEAGRKVAMSLVLLLLVAVYLDFVYRRGTVETRAADDWVKAKSKLIKTLASRSGRAMADYARDLAEGDKAKLEQSEATLADRLNSALAECLQEADSLAAVFDEVLAGSGVRSWRELADLGFVEFLTLGFDAASIRLKQSGGGDLAARQARILGASIGELIGTLLMERTFWKEANSRKGGLVRHKAFEKLAKRTMGGGVWRALWRFVLNPLEQNLEDVIPALRNGLSAADRAARDMFAQSPAGERSYSGLLADLLKDDSRLMARLVALAKDNDLPGRLEAMSASAGLDGVDFPDLATAIKGEDLRFPADAVVFAVFVWTRFAMRPLTECFALLHDRSLFDGKFELSEIFQALGFDVALDDETVARLRTGITSMKG